MGLVSVERRGGAALLVYANPTNGTMTAGGASEMLAAMQGLVVDAAVRAIVITGGVPGTFIRHYDVGELTVLGDALAKAPPPIDVAQSGGGFGALIDLIAAAPKPVIAAINGLCMGGGFELTLACDIRIAAADCTAIGLPETRVGIFPGGGGTQRLPRVIGEARALEMILRGRVVAAADALAIGLVHEVADDCVARALEIAAEFEARPPEGLANAKRLIRSALDRPLSEGLSDERRSFVEVVRLPSAVSAMKASLANAPLGTAEPS